MESQKQPTVTETHRALARSIEIWIRQDGVSPDFIAGQLAELTAESEGQLLKARDALLMEGVARDKAEKGLESVGEKMVAFMGRCAEAEHDADELFMALSKLQSGSQSWEEATRAMDEHKAALGARDGTLSNRLRSDLSARDALCGELRDALTGAMFALKATEADFAKHAFDTPAHYSQRLRLESAEKALARTPSDAGAELEADGGILTIRELRAANSDLRAECEQWRDTAKKLSVLHDQAEARLRAVTEAADKMRKPLDELLGIASESKGIVGWHLNGDVLAWDQVEQIEEAFASLATYDAAKSGDLPPVWRGKLVRVGTFEQGGETITGFICETTREYLRNMPTIPFSEVVAVDGDLPPHPDTARLDWLGSHYGYACLDSLTPMLRWDDKLFPTTLRAAIDAARAQAGKEAQP